MFQVIAKSSNKSFEAGVAEFFKEYYLESPTFANYFKTANKEKNFSETVWLYDATRVIVPDVDYYHASWVDGIKPQHYILAQAPLSVAAQKNFFKLLAHVKADGLIVADGSEEVAGFISNKFDGTTKKSSEKAGEDISTAVISENGVSKLKAVRLNKWADGTITGVELVDMMEKARKVVMSRILVLAAILAVCSSQKELNIKNEKCRTCNFLVHTFDEGLKKTARQHFAGGDTAWEEKNLGKYKTSETRLIEVLEGVCKKSSLPNMDKFTGISDIEFKCATQLEQREETIEEFYYNQQHNNMSIWLCVEQLKLCCPHGHYGKTCEKCPGLYEGSDACFGKGSCHGDGSREGSGKCKCEDGYTGNLCRHCDSEYFEESRTEKSVISTDPLRPTRFHSDTRYPNPMSPDSRQRFYEMSKMFADEVMDRSTEEEEKIENRNECHPCGACSKCTHPCLEKKKIDCWITDAERDRIRQYFGELYR
uniref:EGF-like domain-containing protein n=1 Tax=Caenorhabditis japonica TaxID=281687 RepID=A0A8R1IJ37_CAEJA